MQTGRALNIMMAAGEVSGDRHGAHLARALRQLRPDVRLFGTGGEQMRSAGVDLRLATTHLSSVGLLEPVRFLLPSHRVLRQTQAMVEAERPDVAILIDNTGFNTTLARFLKKRGIPVIYYFPPVVWIASALFCRPVAALAQLVITVFEPEADVYRRYGGRAVWCGHPLIDMVVPGTDHREVFARLGLDEARPLMALLPGSRVQEVERLVRPMVEAARIIRDRHPEVQFILPEAAPHLRDLIDAELVRAGMTGHVQVITDAVYTCLSRCAVILTASGTATLEAALLEVPIVVVYRLRALSHWLGRRVSSTSFFALPNILLNEMVAPEVLGWRATPRRIADAVLDLFEHPERLAAMRARFREVRARLGEPGVIERVAALVLQEAAAARPPVPVRAHTAPEELV